MRCSSTQPRSTPISTPVHHRDGRLAGGRKPDLLQWQSSSEWEILSCMLRQRLLLGVMPPQRLVFPQAGQPISCRLPVSMRLLLLLLLLPLLKLLLLLLQLQLLLPLMKMGGCTAGH